MRRFALTFALVCAAATQADANYCMFADGARNCGYPTFEACLATTRGVGGFCQEDYSSSSIPPNFVQRSRARNRAIPPPDTGPRAGAPTLRTESPCTSLLGTDPCFERR